MRTILVKGPPDGSNPDKIFSFHLDDEDCIIHIPGDSRGPDNATAIEKDQEARVVSQKNGFQSHMTAQAITMPGSGACKSGLKGQVITVWNRDPVRKVVAFSMAHWLAMLAENLENGAFAISHHPGGKEFYHTGFLV